MSGNSDNRSELLERKGTLESAPFLLVWLAVEFAY